ncbi:DNA polymerase III subunit beta [Arthrobacter sp. MYb211]|uniref:DNA polymerase III subunit beta n=1 Tax=Micrococcaceae TaxID=1268 RepID=UPI000BB69925|nr:MULTISPECIES: DNA polymerase III subunit beta [Micrococcaceae]PCC30578.1 DNA polymerase III subunit beta [Glutamicibacter sp. BW80]PQZ97675.1 DNA polymerase III subunit beta [Arthrobacter sp. MYb224]PRA04094.1 DNA polymerase III subunit beta [Arthrobacter sp. MYb229]PRA10110.1 DNA polymerase III subunit beta [Arthrobacter sp. MYb221]PRB51994.1 DNA polymerase III subunit beta [Arthrobacter sp. MYb216]
MKFSVEKDVLADAVSWTARSLAQRPPSPVLAGILITTHEGIVRLEGFDYEISSHIEIPADIAEQGEVLVSGKLLAEITRSLPNSTVTLETDGTKITVSCGRSRFHLATMPVDEYPTLPALPEVAGTINGQAFSEAVSQVIVAASKDDTLPVLTGIKVEIVNDLITFLATDRYRLAMRELNWSPNQPEVSTSFLIKAKTLSEVAKTLSSAGDLKLAISPNGEMIGFESANRRTTSLLINGDYPKIRSLFPDNTPIHATVRTSDLIEAVRRVSVVAERNTPVRMAFTDGQLTLDAGTGEDAQAEEAIVASLRGEDITVAFNPTFLSEGLGSFNTDYVRFSFTSAPKPAMITGQKQIDEDDQDQYRYLVMPVRLPNSN